ncbi:MAG: hypothetical protein M3Y53_05285 [Thermoproteota archaeon]|nr:hypothetical protein [Thermoproteota archaeon]
MVPITCSRFFIVEIEPYTYEQFIETTEELRARRIEEGLASIIAEAVWKKSQDIRDCKDWHNDEIA